MWMWTQTLLLPWEQSGSSLVWCGECHKLAMEWIWWSRQPSERANDRTSTGFISICAWHVSQHIKGIDLPEGSWLLDATPLEVIHVATESDGDWDSPGLAARRRSRKSSRDTPILVSSKWSRRPGRPWAAGRWRRVWAWVSCGSL